jgi:single-strand DNA-binding protein
MACLKMPELNCVMIAGNLTKDPVIRRTTSGIPVANFCIATNRKFRDANNQWVEDVCYVGVVAWSKLAENCTEKLKKGSAVLVDGELQSRVLQSENGFSRTIVEIKAHRIQFLNRSEAPIDLDSLETHSAAAVVPACNEPIGEYTFPATATQNGK